VQCARGCITCTVRTEHACCFRECPCRRKRITHPHTHTHPHTPTHTHTHSHISHSSVQFSPMSIVACDILETDILFSGHNGFKKMLDPPPNHPTPSVKVKGCSITSFRCATSIAARNSLCLFSMMTSQRTASRRAFGGCSNYERRREKACRQNRILN
jgi:hypothetical protein